MATKSTSISRLPEYVAIDYETAINGEASIDFWHPDFRVLSMAASWRAADGSIKSEFCKGENETLYFLEKIAHSRVPIVVHNLGFELGVTLCRFPEVHGVVWLADTMRLVQNFDGGGDAFLPVSDPSFDDLLDGIVDVEMSEGDWIGGLSLANSVQRILGRPNHKGEAYRWLRDHGVKAGKEGAHLHLLPPDIFRAYNVADTEETLRLYEHVTAAFARMGHDWRLDHQLYMSSVNFIVRAQIEGIRVDRERLASYCETVAAEVGAIESQFRGRFAGEIRLAERRRQLDAVRKRKTLRGRKSFLRRLKRGAPTAVKDVAFNIGSNKQLATLFVDVMRMVAKFTTDKGQPSFKSAVLGQWGEGGEILKARRKRLLVLTQAKSLLELSALDGRWHLSLKACGVVTGRLAGGSH